MFTINTGIKNGNHLPGTRVSFCPGQIPANLWNAVVEQWAQEPVFADTYHLRESDEIFQFGLILVRNSASAPERSGKEKR